MFPDLLVLLALVGVEGCRGGELQVGLQVAQRGRKILQVVGEQAAIAQFVSADGSTAINSSVMSRACGNDSIRT
jgi:hypothetical protein